MKCNNKLLISEFVGIIIIIALGFLFHELYEISGNNTIVGLFAPVNESKWEHWKIAFFPALIYSIIEYPFVKDDANNFIFSKAISILTFFLVTFGLIELYELCIGESEFCLHITTFILGAIISQIVSYLLITKTKENRNLRSIGILILSVLFFIFIIFTIKPPKIEYFKDPIDGTYGIKNTYS
ncbi:MAG: DUF6512 family protein [Vallitalea sp.]|jgi:hypothetical protein|nr:DUF6512 family protein [Vallitalea sp.]